MKELKTYLTTTDDLQKLKGMEIGERIKWIREKANSENEPLFTVYRVADQTGLSQSTIARIEGGKVKNPQLPKLKQIAEYLGVNMEVFLDDYYKGILKSFIICSQTMKIDDKDSDKSPFNLLDVAYKVQLTAKVKSTISEFEEIALDETVELTPLDYQEFIDDVSLLVEKIHNRRLTWKTKQNALERLMNEGDTDE
ncbi:helix-turn-helix domain-containing protein [Bacillus halotolerans]|uniref:helix-turn-helix domain-containing protein n=1 Tax=Bacillus halotolerans TaxID=260554 RepID=UPI001C0EA10D|nr:helix-turn-helix transcriptional regulator [Bacillus halotolerans]MBU5248167.1 helix-turn-helix domain-containing protein [Bacillus halotolerans]